MPIQQLELDRTPMSPARLAAEQFFTGAPPKPEAAPAPVIIHRKRISLPDAAAGRGSEGPVPNLLDDHPESNSSAEPAGQALRPPKVFLLGTTSSDGPALPMDSLAAFMQDARPQLSELVPVLQAHTAQADPAPAHSSKPAPRLRRRRDPNRGPRLISHVVFDTSTSAAETRDATSLDASSPVVAAVHAPDGLVAYKQTIVELARLQTLVDRITSLRNFNPFPQEPIAIVRSTVAKPRR